MNKTHKFGIEVIKKVAKYHEPDNKNSNTFWDDVIAKEMKNVKIAFYIMPDRERVPNGYNHICCHMIFDVKMEEFRSKARLVADGHMNETFRCQTYSRIVSQENILLVLTIAALNDLQFKAGDVMNAYVNTPIP